MTIPPATLADITRQGAKDAAAALLAAQVAAAAMIAPMMGSVLIAQLIGAKMDETGDQQFALMPWVGGNAFFVDYVAATNASVTLEGTASVYAAPETEGDEYAASKVLSDMTSPAIVQIASGSATSSDVYASGKATMTQNRVAPYLNVSGASADGSTADWYVFGRILP